MTSTDESVTKPPGQQWKRDVRVRSGRCTAYSDHRTTAARIKRNKNSQKIKFKVRCQRHLYTLVLKDSEKAEKLKQSLPPRESARMRAQSSDVAGDRKADTALALCRTGDQGRPEEE